MHDQGEQRRGQAEAQRRIGAAHTPDETGSSAKECDIGKSAKEAELCRDGERGRVGDKAGRRPSALGSRLARLRLASETDPGQRVIANEIGGLLNLGVGFGVLWAGALMALVDMTRRIREEEEAFFRITDGF